MAFKRILEEAYDPVGKRVAKQIENLSKTYSILNNTQSPSPKKEEKLLTIFDSSQKKEKSHLIGYAFFFSIKSDLPFKFGNEPFRDGRTLKFSDQFEKTYFQLLTKEKILKLISEDIIQLNLNLPIKFNDLKTKSREECLATLGYITFYKAIRNQHFKTKSQYGSSNFSLSLLTKSSFSSWEEFLNTTKTNPLMSFKNDLIEESYPIIKNSKVYKNILSSLMSISPNNYLQKIFRLHVMINQSKYFKLNKTTAIDILNSIIDIYALNQNIGTPLNYEECGRLLRRYWAYNLELQKGVEISNNLILLKNIISEIDETGMSVIYKRLENELKTHPRSLNLANFYIKTRTILNDLNYSIARNKPALDVNNLKTRLLKIYQKNQKRKSYFFYPIYFNLLEWKQ